MSKFPIDIVQHISDKDILFKKEQANYDSVLLTKDSLFVMKHRMLGSEKFQEIDISNIYSFEKITGGESSRFFAGLKITSVGLLISGIIISIPIFSRWLENILFFLSIIAVVAGIHYIVQSLIRIKPHSTIYIEHNHGKNHIAVVFPNIANIDADNLFNRIIEAQKLKKKY